MDIDVWEDMERFWGRDMHRFCGKILAAL